MATNLVGPCTAFTMESRIMELHATTCSQRTLHEAHKARLARFSARALPAPSALNVPVAETEPDQQRVRWLKDAECLAWMAAEMAMYLSSPPPQAIPAILRIQRAACEHFGIPMSEMLSISRRPVPVRTRQVAMYLCRFLTAASWEQLGRKFGRDHTTVWYACKHVAIQRMTSADINASVLALCGELALQADIDSSPLPPAASGVWQKWHLTESKTA